MSLRHFTPFALECHMRSRLKEAISVKSIFLANSSKPFTVRKKTSMRYPISLTDCVQKLPCYIYYNSTSHERHDVSNHRQLHCLFNSVVWLTERINQSYASLSLCKGNPRVSVGFPHKRPVMRKACPPVMISSTITRQRTSLVASLLPET